MEQGPDKPCCVLAVAKFASAWAFMNSCRFIRVITSAELEGVKGN